ncbi:hypothetical protein [Legionella bononiensis]|nr:hypothetical protein [Legionella bononiensis]
MHQCGIVLTLAKEPNRVEDDKLIIRGILDGFSGMTLIYIMEM